MDDIYQNVSLLLSDNGKLHNKSNLLPSIFSNCKKNCWAHDVDYGDADGDATADCESCKAGVDKGAFCEESDDNKAMEGCEAMQSLTPGGSTECGEDDGSMESEACLKGLDE